MSPLPLPSLCNGQIRSIPSLPLWAETALRCLTKITAAGIYTGTVTASQITAGTISADRIAAGSITASKLDIANVKASLITAGNIEALTLNVTKGKIGGWSIGATVLSGNHILLDCGNRRVVVYGLNSGATTGQRVQLYYNSDSDFGLYATNSTGTCVARFGSQNNIAGWTVDASSIRKGNIVLGSDGSITNGTKWKLNNDGSGQIASGNISWDTAGKVSFSPAVSLLWKNDIEAAKTTNYGYPYYYRLVINGEENKYYPVILKGGEQNFKRDILVRRAYSEQAPASWNTSTHKGGLVLLLKANFGGWGGISYSWDIYELSESYCRMFAGAALCGNNCMFAVFLRGGGTTGAVYHIYSDQPIVSNAMSPSPIPAAPQIAYNSDLIFQSGSTKANAPAPRTLTASVEEEIRRKRFIALAQESDSTLAAHPLTYIGSTGIYTGTLTAAQVNAVSINASSIKTGTLSADRIAAGSINASKLDAASIKSSIINTTYINGLSLRLYQRENRWLYHRERQRHRRQRRGNRCHTLADPFGIDRQRLLVYRCLQAVRHYTDLASEQQCRPYRFRTDCGKWEYGQDRIHRHTDDVVGPSGIFLPVGQLYQKWWKGDL